MMKYNKLVVISSDPLCPRILTLFGLSELVNRNIYIEYWDVSQITYPYASKEHTSLQGVFEITLHSNKQFVKEVKRIKSSETLAIVYMNYAASTALCFRVLSKYSVQMAYCVNGVNPFIRGVRLSNILKAPLIWKLIKNRFFIILKKTPLFSALKYQFNTCRMAQVDYKVDNYTKFIPFNCTDLQSLLLPQYDFRFDDGRKKIVFLDQNYANPSDGKLFNCKPINPQKYFNQMNDLFLKLEKRYNCDVVIALHPTADQYDKSNPYNGRKCYHGLSSVLVKNSIGVVAHYSTSVSFAVLTRKPLICVTSNDMNKTFVYYDLCSRQLSDLLDCRWINLDDYVDYSFKDVNEVAYSAYECNFLKHPNTNNLNNGQILYDVMCGKYE